MSTESIEAFLIIGSLTLVVGAALYVPLHFWLKRKLRTENQIAIIFPWSPMDTKLHVTKAGFLVFGLMVAALATSSSLKYLSPESMLGNLVSAPSGEIVFNLAVILAFGVTERLLRAFGVRLVERRNKNDV